MGHLSKGLTKKEADLKQRLKEAASRQIIVPSDTEEVFKEIIHQAAVDLKHKAAAGVATPKDLSSLLKLIESHCKLETLDLKRQELQQTEVSDEEVAKILNKIQEAGYVSAEELNEAE